MYEQVEKPKEYESRAVANSIGQNKSQRKQGFGVVDNRIESADQSKFIGSPCNYTEKLNHSIPKDNTSLIQLMGNDGVIQLSKKGDLTTRLTRLLEIANKVWSKCKLEQLDHSNITSLRSMARQYLEKLNSLKDDDETAIGKVIEDWKEFCNQYHHYFILLKEKSDELDNKELVKQEADDREKQAEDRRLALGRRRQELRDANDTLVQRVVDDVDLARKVKGQEDYNAGYNDNLETEGGNGNPLKLNKGDKGDNFRLGEIVSGIKGSDSGIAKLTFERTHGGNIFVHVT